MAMCTFGGWVHAWWMSVCLVDECMLDGHGALLVDVSVLGG